MWTEDLGRLDDDEDPELVGPEEMPVVRAKPRLAGLVPVYSVLTPTFEDDIPRGIEASVAAGDDAYWGWYVKQRFSWARYYIWFAARRWVQPRDIRKA